MQQNKNKQEHNHAVKLRIMAEDTEEQLNTDEHTDIKKKNNWERNSFSM